MRFVAGGPQGEPSGVALPVDHATLAQLEAEERERKTADQLAADRLAALEELANQDTSLELAAHIIDPTPHPAYDTIPNLKLLYENRLI